MSEVVHYVQGAGRWGGWLTYRLATDLNLPFGGVIAHGGSAERLARDQGVPLVHHPLPGDKPCILWLCIPDDEITGVMEVLPYGAHDKLCVVHASGTAPLPLAPFATGVVWPIQSITRTAEPSWADLPLVVQASTPAFAKTLYGIAAQISGLPPKHVTDDEERQRMHLGATIVQNFGNVLWIYAQEVLAKAGLDYRELLPLARNHLSNLEHVAPADAQTGPAARGDTRTLERHRELLGTHPEASAIYGVLTAVIQGGTTRDRGDASVRRD